MSTTSSNESLCSTWPNLPAIDSESPSLPKVLSMWISTLAGRDHEPKTEHGAFPKSSAPSVLFETSPASSRRAKVRSKVQSNSQEKPKKSRKSTHCFLSYVKIIPYASYQQRAYMHACMATLCRFGTIGKDQGQDNPTATLRWRHILRLCSINNPQSARHIRTRVSQTN